MNIEVLKATMLITNFLRLKNGAIQTIATNNTNHYNFITSKEELSRVGIEIASRQLDITEFKFHYSWDWLLQVYWLFRVRGMKVSTDFTVSFSQAILNNNIFEAWRQIVGVLEREENESLSSHAKNIEILKSKATNIEQMWEKGCYVNEPSTLYYPELATTITLMVDGTYFLTDTSGG